MRNREQGEAKSMTKFQKVVCVLFAAGLVLVLAMGSAGVFLLNRTMDHLREEKHDNAFRLEFAEQQDDLFTRLWQEIREVDAENFQVKFVVTAHPRVFSEKIKAQLMCGDQTAPMTFSGGAFIGEITVPLDMYETGYVVTLEYDGILRSRFETLRFLKLGDGSNVFSYPAQWGEIKGSGANAQYQLDAVLHFFELFLPFDDQADSVRVYAENNHGEELFSAEAADGVVELDMVFPLNWTTVYGEVRGKSGLTYIYPLRKFGYNDGEQFEGNSNFFSFARIVGAKGQELKIERER